MTAKTKPAAKTAKPAAKKTGPKRSDRAHIIAIENALATRLGIDLSEHDESAKAAVAAEVDKPHKLSYAERIVRIEKVVGGLGIPL